MQALTEVNNCRLQKIDGAAGKMPAISIEP
jgi:hypothetical protein